MTVLMPCSSKTPQSFLAAMQWSVDLVHPSANQKQLMSMALWRGLALMSCIWVMGLSMVAMC